MFSISLIAFVAVCIAVLALAFILVFLAIRHDHVVSLQKPQATLDALVESIAQKRTMLDDLDDELGKRREALAHVAEVGAEVDALERRRDELLAEWGQLEARRQEVSALRLEAEQAAAELLNVNGELAALRADLEETRERRARAEALLHGVDALEERKRTLQAEVDELRDVRDELDAAASRLAAARAEVEQLGAVATARRQEAEDAEAKLQSVNADVERATSLLEDRRRRLDDVTAQLSALEASLAGQADALRDASQKRQGVEERVLELEQRLVSLEARKAALEEEIRKAQATADGVAGPDGEALDPLREPPQVIQNLASWKTGPSLTEAEALYRVKERFKAFGLQYHDRTLRAFHTAMKVNDVTQMTVLAGISGTGKSQLPRHYAAGMGIGFLQVPVQPRWDSPQDLLGFYNFIEKRFRPTDMARALYALDEQNNKDAIKDRMLMVLLDEMNLARVEYYFSDFLSRLESRPAPGDVKNTSLRKDAELELELPNAQLRIFPGYNLLFAGTMNEDESTQSLSDKVVDRANVMRFSAPRQIQPPSQAAQSQQPELALSRKLWESWARRPERADARAEEAVNRMLAVMQSFGKPFGHRLGRAILAYVAAYPEVDGVGDRVKVALADQIEMRLLPKLRGVDVEEKEQEFYELQRLAEEFGDSALSEAIADSVSSAAEGASRQFIWKGVTR